MNFTPESAKLSVSSEPPVIKVDQNWLRDRQIMGAEADRVLDSLYAIQGELQNQNRDRPPGIGHNQEAASVDDVSLRAAIDFTNVFRTEISSENPQSEILRVCAAGFRTTLLWLRDRLTKAVDMLVATAVRVLVIHNADTIASAFEHILTILRNYIDL